MATPFGRLIPAILPHDCQSVPLLEGTCCMCIASAHSAARRSGAGSCHGRGSAGQPRNPRTALIELCWGCVWRYSTTLAAMQGATVYKLGPGAPTELTGGGDIKFEEPAYSMGAGAQGDFDSPVLRLRYSSLSNALLNHRLQHADRREVPALASLCSCKPLFAISLCLPECMPRRAPVPTPPVS